MVSRGGSRVGPLTIGLPKHIFLGEVMMNHEIFGDSLCSDNT